MANTTKEVITESSAPKKRQSVYSRAGAVAYKKALSSGVPVCFTEGTVIYKMFPNGKKRSIGQVNPPVKLTKKAFCV